LTQNNELKPKYYLETSSENNSDAGATTIQCHIHFWTVTFLFLVISSWNLHDICHRFSCTHGRNSAGSDKE